MLIFQNRVGISESNGKKIILERNPLSYQRIYLLKLLIQTRPIAKTQWSKRNSKKHNELCFVPYMYNTYDVVLILN